MDGRTLAKLLLALLLSAASLSAGGCGMIRQPDVSITGVQMTRVNLTDATMLFDVKVDNPYSVDLPLSNVDYALSSKGKLFLEGRAPLDGAVPAGGSRTVAVPVRVDFLRTLQSVRDARPGSSIPYKADLGVAVETPMLGEIRVPASREGALDIPTGTRMLGPLRDLGG